MVRNCVRIMLLNYKLKIIFWKDIFHPIFVTFMSIFQNITAIFKLWLKKRHDHFSSKMIKVQDYMKQIEKMHQFQGQDKLGARNQSYDTSTGSD